MKIALFLFFAAAIILSGDLNFKIYFILAFSCFFNDVLKDEKCCHRETDHLPGAEVFSLSTADSTATCYAGAQTRTLNLQHIHTFRRCVRYSHSLQYCVEAVTVGPQLTFFEASDPAIIDSIVLELNKSLDGWRAGKEDTPSDVLRLMEDWFEHDFIRVTKKTNLSASPQGILDFKIDKSSPNSFTCSRPFRDLESIIRARFVPWILAFGICVLMVMLLCNKNFILGILPSYIWEHMLGFDNEIGTANLFVLFVFLVCVYCIKVVNENKLHRKYHFLNQNIEAEMRFSLFRFISSVAQRIIKFVAGDSVINMGNVQSVFIIRDVATPPCDLENGKVGHDEVTGRRYHILLFCRLYRFPYVIHCLTKSECLHLAKIIRSTFPHICES